MEQVKSANDWQILNQLGRGLIRLALFSLVIFAYVADFVACPQSFVEFSVGVATALLLQILFDLCSYGVKRLQSALLPLGELYKVPAISGFNRSAPLFDVFV